MSVTTAERELDLDDALDVFLTERTRLFRIAHRVVGDPAVAEDVVQEAWVRWQRTDRRAIKNPAAFLTTATTHLAINVVQSARHRHERPTDVPHAELADPAPDPTTEAERAAAAAQILGSLMARLSPAELAAYVLRKAFGYPYAEVSRVLGVSTPNARQLVHRAHLRLLDSRPCRVDPDAHRRLVRAFLVAARTGALEPLEHVLVHVTDRRVTFG